MAEPTKLADYRASKDLTQQALAKAAGVSVDTIKRAERGLRIRLRTEYRIAHALGVPRELLFPPGPPLAEAASA